LKASTISLEEFSCPGRQEKSEDSVLALSDNDNAIVLAAADGIGGYNHGEVASSLAISQVEEWFNSDHKTSFADLFSGIQEALVRVSAESYESQKLGTTLTLCLISDDTATVAHVGDCRVYQLRGNGLRTHTRDQSELALLLRKGVVKRGQAKKYPRRNILLSVLSSDSQFEMDQTEFEVKPGDRIIVCTDGVHKKLSKPEIRDASGRSASLEQFAQEIKSAIRTRDVDDDYSAAMAQL